MKGSVDLLPISKKTKIKSFLITNINSKNILLRNFYVLRVYFSHIEYFERASDHDVQFDYHINNRFFLVNGKSANLQENEIFDLKLKKVSQDLSENEGVIFSQWHSVHEVTPESSLKEKRESLDNNILKSITSGTCFSLNPFVNSFFPHEDVIQNWKLSTEILKCLLAEKLIVEVDIENFEFEEKCYLPLLELIRFFLKFYFDDSPLSFQEKFFQQFEKFKFVEDEFFSVKSEGSNKTKEFERLDPISHGNKDVNLLSKQTDIQKGKNMEMYQYKFLISWKKKWVKKWKLKSRAFKYLENEMEKIITGSFTDQQRLYYWQVCFLKVKQYFLLKNKKKDLSFLEAREFIEKEIVQLEEKKVLYTTDLLLQDIHQNQSDVFFNIIQHQPDLLIKIFEGIELRGDAFSYFQKSILSGISSKTLDVTQGLKTFKAINVNFESSFVLILTRFICKNTKENEFYQNFPRIMATVKDVLNSRVLVVTITAFLKKFDSLINQDFNIKMMVSLRDYSYTFQLEAERVLGGHFDRHGLILKGIKKEAFLKNALLNPSPEIVEILKKELKDSLGKWVLLTKLKWQDCDIKLMITIREQFLKKLDEFFSFNFSISYLEEKYLHYFQLINYDLVLSVKEYYCLKEMERRKALGHYFSSIKKAFNDPKLDDVFAESILASLPIYFTYADFKKELENSILVPYFDNSVRSFQFLGEFFSNFVKRSVVFDEIGQIIFDSNHDTQNFIPVLIKSLELKENQPKYLASYSRYWHKTSRSYKKNISLYFNRHLKGAYTSSFFWLFSKPLLSPIVTQFLSDWLEFELPLKENKDRKQIIINIQPEKRVKILFQLEFVSLIPMDPVVVQLHISLKGTLGEHTPPKLDLEITQYNLGKMKKLRLANKNKERRFDFLIRKWGYMRAN